MFLNPTFSRQDEWRKQDIPRMAWARHQVHSVTNSKEILRQRRWTPSADAMAVLWPLCVPVACVYLHSHTQIRLHTKTLKAIGLLFFQSLPIFIKCQFCSFMDSCLLRQCDSITFCCYQEQKQNFQPFFLSFKAVVQQESICLVFVKPKVWLVPLINFKRRKEGGEFRHVLNLAPPKETAFKRIYTGW